MSNQVNLMLRPPPNVDFVHGYPGIPPMAPDRPQACVKGEVEVRVGANGVKAKWVRIELRKVETLPGGGQAVFYDFVGPSPITLWSAGDEEYQTLHGHNYPFSIRIPESIPPTIALENRAGIKYELVASVCVKGKRKMLRQTKAQVVTYIAPIIIDKHELHSTWPVYCQPDSREFESSGITLHIERNHTCYGPGDRITVSAVVKSQSIHTVTLRAFEFSLHELSVFRGSAGVSAQGKKGGQPQSKSIVVDESKVPVNATLYGGTQHRAELALNLNPRHTTTTLNTARHIDITYTLRVTAILASGEPLNVELPVIISNWQRQVSEEAIKRIGPAPSLSLTQTMPGATHADVPTTFNGRPSNEKAGYLNSPGKFASMPNGHAAGATASSNTNGSLGYDDFGYTKANTSGKAAILANEVPLQQQGVPMGAATLPPNRTSVFQVDDVSGRAAQARRPVSARSTDSTTAARLTIANPGQQQWMSAEEEKARLYSSARDKVDKVQGVAPKPITPSPTTPKKSLSTTPTWMTAEEEKLKLFNEAKATAERNQSLASSSPSSGTFDSQPLSAAAAMYQSAMASRSTGASVVPAKTQQQQPTPSKLSGVSASANGGKSYMSAEEEKAQLRRYQEAKEAVERTQGKGFGGATRAASPPPPAIPSSSSTSAAGSSGPPPPPVGLPMPYDSLYSPPGGGSDMPPPFAPAGSSSSSAFNPNLSEKERVRRAYEAQDAAPPPMSDVPAYSPPTAQPKVPIVGRDILSEKERLRRKYEQEDAAALAAQQGQGSAGIGMASTPPYSPPPAQPRSKPTPPPASSSSQRVMSAEEEKALLKAKYASQDQAATNGHATPPPFVSSPPPFTSGDANLHASPSVRSIGNIPPPPPLLPRPPADYIRETKEEDARVARFVSSDSMPPGMDDGGYTNGSAVFRKSSISPPPPLPPKPVS